jgi:hypothetical protein
MTGCLTAAAISDGFPAMPSWLMRAGRFLLVVFLAITMGGHLALLQTIAWGAMLYSYSGKASFSQAVTMTFDGAHPCELCKLVGKSKQDEDRKQAVLGLKKQDVVLAVVVCAPRPRGGDLSAPAFRYDQPRGGLFARGLLRPPRSA